MDLVSILELLVVTDPDDGLTGVAASLYYWINAALHSRTLHIPASDRCQTDIAVLPLLQRLASQQAWHSDNGLTGFAASLY